MVVIARVVADIPHKSVVVLGVLGVSRVNEEVVFVVLFNSSCLVWYLILVSSFVVSRNSSASVKPASSRILRQTIAPTGGIPPSAPTGQ